VRSWIDKKKSRTYTLMSRNVEVQGGIENNMVFKKVGPQSKYKDDLNENGEEKEDNNLDEDKEDNNLDENGDLPDNRVEVDFDDHFGDDEYDEDGYDYSQHIKSIGGGTYMSSEGILGIEVKPNLLDGLNLNEEDDLYSPDMDPVVDPEIIDAIENTEEYEELNDDFIKQANKSDSEDETDIVEKDEIQIIEDITQYDFDIEQDIQDDDFPIESKEIYIPKHPETGEKTFLEELFEAENEGFGKDESSSEEIEIPGLISQEEFSNLMSDFINDYQKEQYIPDENLNNIVKNLEQLQEDHSDEEFETIFVKEKSPWDCESILSSYSNTENHPKLIAIPDEKNKILLNKQGFPIDKEQIEKENNEEKEIEDSTPKINEGTSRNKNETKEEKKLRKQEIKKSKKEKRGQKKDLKLEYQGEMLRQKNMIAGRIVNRKVIQY